MPFGQNEKVDQMEFATERVAAAEAALAACDSLEDPAVIEALLTAEKKCRLSNDAIATKLVATTIIKMCRARKAWAAVAANCTLLAKRRAQSKLAISGIVEAGIELLTAEPAEVDDVGAKETILKALCEITDGKMYCEAERAKLTRMLSGLKEAAGDVAAAADILQDINVETYGALSKREKVDYILDQVRLMLAKGDRVRAYILSKKVQRKTLEEDDLQDLKVRFYKLMSESPRPRGESSSL